MQNNMQNNMQYDMKKMYLICTTCMLDNMYNMQNNTQNDMFQYVNNTFYKSQAYYFAYFAFMNDFFPIFFLILE
jgi:hypothetical protein